MPSSRFPSAARLVLTINLIGAATALALLCFRLFGWLPAALLLLTLLGVGFIIVWRNSNWSLVGPLFYYDLARLAQRNRTIQLRCLYLVVVAVILGALSLGQVPRLGQELLGQSSYQSNAGPGGGEETVAMILLLQTVALFILTPAYLASAFSEEKERKTIQFLFVTDLHDHEIFLGKLLGRLTLLATIVLSSLPLVCFYTSWGPVDHSMVLVGLSASILALLSMGSISILCSVLCPSTFSAVVSSYALVGGLVLLCTGLPAASPVFFLPHCELEVETAWRNWDDEVASIWRNWKEDDAFNKNIYPANGRGSVGRTRPPLPPRPVPALIRLWNFVPFALAHGAIFLCCSVFSILIVRQVCLAPGLVNPSSSRPDDLEVGARATEINSGWDWQPTDIVLARPPCVVKEPALMWKEMELGEFCFPAYPRAIARELKPSRTALIVLAVLILALSIYVRSFCQKQDVLDFDATVAQGIGYLTAFFVGVWSLVLGFRAAGSITREREQDTLQALLMLPGKRTELLQAKWLGSILRFGGFGYWMAIVWILGLLIGVLHPLSLIFLIGSCIIYLSFVALMGLWISLTSRSTLWANLTMVLALMLCFSGPIARQILAFPGTGMPWANWLRQAPETLLNPAAAIRASAFPWQTVQNKFVMNEANLAMQANIFLRQTTGPDQSRKQWDELRSLAMIPLNLAFFAVLAGLLWWLARREFSKAFN